MIKTRKTESKTVKTANDISYHWLESLKVKVTKN